MIRRLWSVGLFGIALGCAVSALACSSSSTSTPAPVGGGNDPGGGTGGGDGGGSDYVDAAVPDLTILPLKAYSGFDGTHKYQVPIGVYGAGTDLTFTAAPAATVQIEPARLSDPTGDDGKYFMVTMKAAGLVTLTASSRGKSVSTELTITTYSLTDYAAGQARYQNGEGTDPPCLQCHSEQGGIDHSPAAMASAQDGDVLRVVMSGLLVSGAPITQVKHKWTLTDAEQKGIIPFLRALTPRGFVVGN